jgi:hypothetical protein
VVPNESLHLSLLVYYRRQHHCFINMLSANDGNIEYVIDEKTAAAIVKVGVRIQTRIA